MEIFENLDWFYDIVPSKLCQTSTPHYILLSYNAKAESHKHNISCLIRNKVTQLGLKGVIVPPIFIEPVALLPQHTRGSNSRASSKMLVVLLTVALLALSSAQRPNEGMQIWVPGWGSCLGIGDHTNVMEARELKIKTKHDYRVFKPKKRLLSPYSIPRACKHFKNLFNFTFNWKKKHFKQWNENIKFALVDKTIWADKGILKSGKFLWLSYDMTKETVCRR